MKAYLLLLLTLFAALSLCGQTLKVYPDAASFNNGKPIVPGNIAITERTTFDKVFFGGDGDYKITADDKATCIKLKEEYWAVEWDSVLLLNAHLLLQSEGYVPVLYRSANFLFFMAQGHGVAGNYLVYVDWGGAMPLSKKSFAGLLKMKNETALLEKYQQEEEPTDIATYIRYLKMMEKN